MPTTTAAAELRFQAMGCDVHVRRALQGARVTGGRYGPTVLGDVLRAGYDRSFEQLAGHDPGAGRPAGTRWSSPGASSACTCCWRSS
jgi:hypothetical protein